MRSPIEEPQPETEPPVIMPVSKPLTAAETIVLTMKVLAGMAAVGGLLWLAMELSDFISIR